MITEEEREAIRQEMREHIAKDLEFLADCYGQNGTTPEQAMKSTIYRVSATMARRCGLKPGVAKKVTKSVIEEFVKRHGSPHVVDNGQHDDVPVVLGPVDRLPKKKKKRK